MTIEKVLKNGVKVYSLDVEADLNAVVDMFDYNYNLSQCDVWDAYENRVSNEFVGSYKVEVSSTTEYDRFIQVLKNQVEAHKNQLGHTYWSKIREFESIIIKQYMRGLISDSQAQEFKQKAERKAQETVGRCSCGLCSFHRYPTMEEWKTGKYQEGSRVIKLGKKLLKSGFPPMVLDYYSAQHKRDSKSMYFTISDLPQHIAGMTYYAKDWSSCQDPRDEDSDYCKGLIGSLHDDKLFIGMLHESLDDLADMEGKLVGRTMMRLLHVDGTPVLVSTTYYADYNDRGYVKSAVEQLAELDIYTRDCMFEDAIMEEVQEPANGKYKHVVTEEVHIHETIEEDVDCDCPACHGSGRYEVQVTNGDYVKIDCPVCGGSGDYSTYVYADIDEWIDVEVVEYILPYDENYSHYSDYISMNIRIEGVRRCRAEREGIEYLSEHERDAQQVSEMRESLDLVLDDLVLDDLDIDGSIIEI